MRTIEIAPCCEHIAKPIMSGGVVGVEFHRATQFPFRAGEIPVVVKLDVAERRVRCGGSRSEFERFFRSRTCLTEGIRWRSIVSIREKGLGVRQPRVRR